MGPGTPRQALGGSCALFRELQLQRWMPGLMNLSAKGAGAMAVTRRASCTCLRAPARVRRTSH